MTNNPKISIITIVFNDVAHLESTILSVINQDYANIDYVIIDGGSKDGSVDLIKKYNSKISYWSSEPDKGIYDAMNKGIKAAKGDYIWFLNSGDKIYTDHLISAIFLNIKNELPDVIYGETMIIAEDGSEIGLRRLKAPEHLTWKSLTDGMVVCHQSFIASRKITPKYNLNYKIASDYDWMLKTLRAANSIYNSHQIISGFLDGGTSKKNIRASLKERFKIMSENYGFIPTLFQHIFIGFRFWRFFLKNKRF